LTNVYVQPDALESFCRVALTEAGAVFCRDRTTAAHACRVVEDRRDSPHIDAVVSTVEEQLQSWIAAMEFCRQTVEGNLE